jgi:hypothetical protein
MACTSCRPRCVEDRADAVLARDAHVDPVIRHPYLRPDLVPFGSSSTATLKCGLSNTWTAARWPFQRRRRDDRRGTASQDTGTKPESAPESPAAWVRAHASVAAPALWRACPPPWVTAGVTSSVELACVVTPWESASLERAVRSPTYRSPRAIWSEGTPRRASGDPCRLNAPIRASIRVAHGAGTRGLAARAVRGLSPEPGWVVLGENPRRAVCGARMGNRGCSLARPTVLPSPAGRARCLQLHPIRCPGAGRDGWRS